MDSDPLSHIAIASLVDCGYILSFYVTDALPPSTTTLPTPHSLSLMINTFKMAFTQALSKGEVDYILAGVEQGIRSDGRGRLDYRYLSIESGVLQQANGSARVSILNSATTVLAAVKAEITTPDSRHPARGFIEVSVENSTSISRDLEGRGADAVNVEHTQGLQRVLVQSNVIDLDKLCIVEGKYVWTIYVDILVLDSGGNLFDIIILAAYTALCNTKIPNVEIIPAETIEETEFDIIDDPAAATSLDVAAVPVCITLSKMGHRYVVDTTLEEEACVDSKLLISVKRNGTICGMQKTGMGAIDINSTYSLFQWSRTIGKTLFEKIDEALKIERSRDSTIITDTVMEKLNLFY